MRWEVVYDERRVAKKRRKEKREGQTMGEVVNKPLSVLSDTKMRYQMLQYY
jgi:hypothetical protein